MILKIKLRIVTGLFKKVKPQKGTTNTQPITVILSSNTTKTKKLKYLFHIP